MAPLPARLADLCALVSSWPQLDELRRAAASNPTSTHDRRKHAASSLAATARSEMTAALLASRETLAGRAARPGVRLRSECDAAALTLNGELRHASLLSLLDGGLRTLAAHWLLPERDVLVAESFLRTVVGPPVVFGSAQLPGPAELGTLGEESTVAPPLRRGARGRLAVGPRPPPVLRPPARTVVRRRVRLRPRAG